MLLAHELIGVASSPSLVLIHGITESRHTWHPLLHELAREHQVLAVDLRGHGESDDDDGYDPASYAADVIETAESLGVTDALVVGHSLGGIVATAFAVGASCRGVVNIDQPLRLSGFKEQLAAIEPMLRGDDQEFQKALDLMLPTIQQTLLKEAIPQCQALRVTPTSLGYEAALLGAASVCLEGLSKSGAGV